MAVSLVAHCDWSIDPRKRRMCVATRRGSRWVVGEPEPVGDTASLGPRLRSRTTREGTVLIGFDFPIGLPAAYGRRLGLGSFKEALAQFGAGDFAAWFDVAEDRGQISLYRPFYPMRPGGTLRRHLFDALGLTAGDLLRRCERATTTRGDACMLFWTLGGNQVGKAAISGWREVIIPNLATTKLWPFDGPLASLIAPGAIIMAETYPGDVYGQLGIPRRPVWSKRQQSGRKAVAPYLTRWLSARPHVDATALDHVITDGFGTEAAGEDRFDAAIGLLGMLDVVDGNRREGAPADEAISTWEGWIFGQESQEAT